jgi:hypothetical protein
MIDEFGEKHVNNNGQELRQFANKNRLKIIDTFYRKKYNQKYTWNARGYRKGLIIY